jgi:small GTP-binding protein
MGRKINICFAGDSGVGKSSILKRIQKGEFDELMSITLGYAHYSDKKSIQGIDTTVCLIDTGGQDRFRAMAPSYFRDADGIFLIFSLEDDRSIRGL